MVHFLCKKSMIPHMDFVLFSYRVKHSGGTSWYILRTAPIITSLRE